MTHKSIFGTERPTLGSVIQFDTPGQNETQLDEDKFEQEIINYFQRHSCLSHKRVAHIAGMIFESGELTDYFRSVERGFALMELLPSVNSQYKKTSRGYVLLDFTKN